MDGHQSKNLDRGIVPLFGEIDDEAIQNVLEQIFYLEKRSTVKEITLWINSTGGLLQPALGLSDVLELLKTPVRTIGLGTIESAATVVLMSGSKGRRFVTQNASVMVHEYSWSNSGSMTEMRGRQVEILQTAEKQIRHFCLKSGLSPEVAKTLLRHEETWLNPQRAVELGLIDGILDFHPLSPTPKKYLPKEGRESTPGRSQARTAKATKKSSSAKAAKSPKKKGKKVGAEAPKKAPKKVPSKAPARAPKK